MADDDRRSVGVRVRPNSHDFIRQLRADLATKKATFYVDVRAKTTGATADVRRWANTDLKKISAFVPVRANTGLASRDMADWRRRQAAIKTEVKVTADTSAARREIEALRAMARDVTIKIKADRSGVGPIGGGGGGTSRARRSNIDKEFEAGLKKGLDAAMSRLDEIPVKVAADTTKAKAQTEAFRRSEANKLIKQQLDIDNKRAMLKLREFRLAQQANDIKIKVDVQTSKFDLFVRKMKDVEKSFGSFTIIRSLDFGPFNLGKPSGIIGTLTTLTALAGAIPGAVTGIAALSDALVRLAGAASIVPGAIGAIGASIATLAVGTSGVSDTIGALFDMWNESATKGAVASKKAITAQNNYRNAVVDEAKAQRDVATARREALSDLRNLNNELRGGVLNEAQALLDLQKARDRYAQGGFENETDRLQALLDIQRASLNVDQTRQSNIDLQLKANDANAKGVEGSDKVTAALEAQARASQSVAESLEAIAAANNGVTPATDKFNQLLQQLSPNAQDFVKRIAGMKDELYGFRNAIQDTIFQGAGPAFSQMFDNLLPVVQPGMEKVAEGMNHVIMEAFDTLQTPEGKSIIERILGGTAETQDAIAKTINPLVRGFGTLVAAGTEHLPQVIDLINQLATRFANFIEEADRNGTLDKFMDDGITALKNLTEIGINLVKVINDFSNAFRTAFGEDILTKIANITSRWHEFLSSDEGQKKLLDFIAKARDIWGEWEPILEKLPGLFENLSNAAIRVLNLLLPTINGILKALEKFPGLVEAFAAMWLGTKALSMFTKVYELGKTLGKMAGFLTTMASKALDFAANWNAIRNPFPGAPGAPGAAGPGLGNAATTAAAAGPGVAAQVAQVAAPILAFGAILVGTEYLGKKQSEREGTTVDLPIGPHGANVPVKPKLPTGVPEPQTQEARDIVQQGVDKGDASSKWVAAGRDIRDWQKRYVWVATHPELASSPNFTPPRDYFKGGYTDWGVHTGRMAELHGGEYVQPHQTVNHYGVDAMKAIHDKRAVVSYATGGMMPMADPNWEQPSPKFPGPPPGIGYVPGDEWLKPLYPWMPRGAVPGPGGMTIPGFLTPGIGGGLLPGQNLWDWINSHPPMGSHDQGGLVYDPTTGQYVQEGPAISHGVNPLQGSPGIIDTATNAAVGIGSNFAQQGANFAQSFAGQTASGSVTPGGPNIPGSPGYTGLTGPLPGPGNAPGVGVDAQGIPYPNASQPTGTTGSAFLDSFLGAVGIPGSTNQTTSGPGWGPDGAPAFLGGEGGPKDPRTGLPIDIRNFGIGPGPPGSGPADWASFTGQTLGKFGAGLATTFFSGVLDFFGLTGLSSYISSAGGVASHFLTPADQSKAQGPGAAQTNADVTNALNTFANMPGNPPWPGAPNLPGVFDPTTGSVLQQLPPGYGVGPNGAVTYDTKNPQLSTLSYLKNLAQSAGLRVGSGPSDQAVSDALGIPTHFRDQGYHPRNMALDIGNGPDDVGFARWWVSDPSRVAATKELILNVPGWDANFNIKDGKFIRDMGGVGSVYDPKTLNDHTDHLHLALGSIPNLMAVDSSGTPVALPAVDTGTSPSTGSTGGYTSWFSTGSSGGGYGGLRLPPGGHGNAPGRPGSRLNPALSALASGSGQPGNNPLYGPLSTTLNKATLKQIARRMYLAAGMPPGEWDDFDQLIEHESGWDPTAKNPSSTAFGLGQFLDTTQARYGLTGNRDPLAQLPAIFEYLRERDDYRGSPARAWALWQARTPHWYDQGGWLPPGQTNVINATGKPELVIPYDHLRSYADGGFVSGLPVIPPPRPPDIIKMQPPPTPPPTPTKPTIPQVPPTTTPPVGPAAPISPSMPPAPAAPPPTAQGPAGGQISIAPWQPPITSDVKDSGDHVHPALRKGITSGFATAGNLAAMAINTGMAMAGAAGGGVGGAAGGAAGGSLGGFVAGLFQQAGKIANNVANVASSFLVGNITGGTTENPYGVTQRGNVPTGGTKVVDASNIHNGDIYTNNLDEYFAMVDRRNAQRSQVALGRWGTQL